MKTERKRKKNHEKRKEEGKKKKIPGDHGSALADALSNKGKGKGNSRRLHAYPFIFFFCPERKREKQPPQHHPMHLPCLPASDRLKMRLIARAK